MPEKAIVRFNQTSSPDPRGVDKVIGARVEGGQTEFVLRREPLHTLSLEVAEAELRDRLDYRIYERTGNQSYRETHLVVPVAYQLVSDDHDFWSVEWIFPLVKGADLERLLRERENSPSFKASSFSQAELLKLVEGISEALSTLHIQMNIAHGDLHEGNIMSSDQEYYVIDFGKSIILDKPAHMKDEDYERLRQKSIHNDVDNLISLLKKLLVSGNGARLLHSLNHPSLLQQLRQKWNGAQGAEYAVRYKQLVEEEIRRQYGEQMTLLLQEASTGAFDTNLRTFADQFATILTHR